MFSESINDSNCLTDYTKREVSMMLSAKVMPFFYPLIMS
jgi:hypothetical protein